MVASSFVDPLTGLDLSQYEQTIYQIPLDSDPVLAPAWKPQGRYGQVLHPDNIPTIFSTLQAYNNAAPRTVDALSTDGNMNLNVKVVNPSSGGGLSPMPYRHETMDGSWPVPESEASFESTVNHPRYLLGVSIALWTTVSTWVYVVVAGNFQEPGPGFTFYVTPSAPVNKTIMFPIPWDVYVNYPPFPFTIDYRAKAEHLGARLAMSLIYVDAQDLP